MISGDQVFGIISVQNADREDAYNQEHLELLQTIAAQAAAAVANARLYFTFRVLRPTVLSTPSTFLAALHAQTPPGRRSAGNGRG